MQLSVSATVSTYFFYLAESKELAMFTHLFVTHDNAEKLFTNFAKETFEGDGCDLVAPETFDEYFEAYGQTYLNAIGAMLEIVHQKDLFVLRFDGYLAHVPQKLNEIDVSIAQAEIKRFSSAPTKARAGYYENAATGFVATVERTFPTQHLYYRKQVPLYAQNITVTGPSLADAQDFNTKLSCGFFKRFLVNAFE
ncbi:hypothetical protein I8H83_02330 [Candidatus Saccharibacteria bacterium]|nr:hypothetical protein [Candidatus Saccharibacteria bacterium]